MRVRVAVCSLAFSVVAALCSNESHAQDMIAVNSYQYAGNNIFVAMGESDFAGGFYDLAVGELEIVDAAGNGQLATIYLSGDGRFMLVTDSPVVLPLAGVTTGPLVDMDSGVAVEEMMLIEVVDIPKVEYGDLDNDAQNRITDLQTPPVKNINNAGNNEFKKYKNITAPKLPSDGDYQEIYVKDGDTDKRFVYDWKNKKIYYTDDHYKSWKEVNDPWKIGKPVFPYPM